MLGALLLTLKTDKQNYLVGDAPIYTLQNAQPGSLVKWTSFKDGEATGEYEENYGGTIGSVGGAELTGGAFTDKELGRWQKIAVVYAPDGSKTTASTYFNVLPVASSQPVTQPANQENWLSGSFEFDVGTEHVSVNRGVGLLIGGFVGWMLFSTLKTKRR